MPRDRPLRLAVFDVDGTLVDSLATIAATMAAAWREVALPPPAPAAVYRIIGLPLEQTIATLAPDAPPSVRVRLAAAYRRVSQAMYARAGYSETLFPGALDALAALEATGARLGIATGKGMPGLRAMLDPHDLAHRFTTLQTGDRARGKPHPEMLERAMAETGTQARHVVMIGDTVYDIEMARNAGVAALGVAWGCHGADELRAAGAVAVIDDFAVLPGLFAQLTGHG